MVCYLCCKVFRNEWLAYMVITIIALYVDMSYTQLNLNSMLPCFIFGIIYSKYEHLIFNHRYLLLLGSILIYLVSILHWDFRPENTSEMPSVQLVWFFAFRLLLGLSGTMVFFLLFSMEDKTTKLISFIGANTIVFYGLNILFSVFLWKIVRVFAAGDMVLWKNYICTFMLCILQVVAFSYISNQMRKSKQLRFLFMGNR